MSKAARWTMTAALLAVLVGFAAWWLLNTRADESDAAAARSAATSSSAALPEAEAAPVLPSPTDGAPAAPLAANTQASAATPAAASADFTGRVVDALHRPVVGATVLHWPSLAVRVKTKIGYSDFGGPVDRSQLASTRTDADGHFTLAIVDVPPGPDALQNFIGGTPNQQMWDTLVPSLIVLHPDFEATVFPCRGWTGGPHAAGELVVQPGASVAGRAVDEAHQPLAGVAVAPPPFLDREDRKRFVEWDTVSKLLGTVTGEDGRFVLDSLWAGKTPISLTLAGRNGVVLEPVLQAGETRNLGDVVLPGGAAIEGVVQDTKGAGLAGVRVLARPDAAFAMQVPEADRGIYEAMLKLAMNGLLIDVETTTDATGHFRLSGLASDKIGRQFAAEDQAFRVIADAEGFEPALLSMVKADKEPVTFTLWPEGSLVLTVTEPGGQQPVPQLDLKVQRVVMDGEYKSPLTLPVVSDPAALAAAGLEPPFAGVFLVHRAGNSRNEVRLSAPGHATQGFVLPNVLPGERKSLSLELPRASRLGGRILDADKQPIADALVALVLPETLRVQIDARRTHADAQGRFDFDLLQRGDWAVQASAIGFIDGESPRITVKKETAVEGVELVLQRAGAIEGVVLVRGAPLPGVVVRADPPEAPAPQGPAAAVPAGSTKVKSKGPDPAAAKRSAQTDTAGHFRIDSLAPGTFMLSGPPGVKQSVEVAAGETTQVTVVAHAPPRVHGQVRDSKGPIAGAEVKAEYCYREPDSWTDETTATCDRDGRYELAFEDVGRYRLRANAGQSNTAPAELSAEWDADLTVDLVFPSGTMSGVVVEDGSGAPVPDAFMSLWDATSRYESAGWNTHARTGADGHFELTGVPAGALLLLASTNDHSAAPALSVQLPASGALTDLHLVLKRAGVLAGTVTAAAGLGDGLRLRCVPLAGQSGDGRVTIDADGHFSLPRLEPGAWRCEVYRRANKSDGPALVSRDVQIKAGETTNVELTLP